MQALQVAGIVVLALFLLICAFAGFGHLTRGTPIERVRSLDDSGPPPVSSDAFCDVIQLAAGAAMHQGNHVEILFNGATYPRLWADLRSARQTITLQLYYCQPGRLAEELKEILIDRARTGVKVMFLRDAIGSQKLTKEYLAELTSAGVRVCAFRPTHWYQLHKAQNRSHIRVAIVDGRVAYTGGFGIDDKWMGDGRTGGSWRDTNVRFAGPAVAQHQATFMAGWAEASGDLLTGEGLFPSGALSSDAGKAAPAPASGDAADDVLAAAVHCAPTMGSTAAERLLALTICGAQRSLYIANAYFVPDDDFRRMLVEAAKRGVDVRILAAGPPIDTKLTWHASHARYEELISGGVRIFEYQPTMMHAKTVVVDGLWSIVGTMNFDNRSFALNDESVLMTHDGRVASTIERHYLDDLTRSREITLEEWRKRPLLDRARERGATLFSRLL